MIRKGVAIMIAALSFFTLAADDFAAECQRVERWIKANYPAGSSQFHIHNNRLRHIRRSTDDEIRKIRKLRRQFPRAFAAEPESDLQWAKAQGITFSADNKTLLRCPEHLTDVVIPSCVTAIGDRAFYRCKRLTAITIPGNVTSIGNMAFYHCTGLTSVTISDSVTFIGDMAFFGCLNLREVKLSDKLTHIGEKAFGGIRNLSGITVPGTTTFIGDGAFSHVKRVDAAAGNTVFKVDAHGALLDLQRKKILYLPPDFSGEYVIQQGMTHIGSWAFIDRKNLTGITIPRSMINIGKFAFARCKNLTGVVIPAGVTAVETGAFSECTKLKSITVPGTVVTIDSRAFEKCGMAQVTIPAGVTRIGSGAFQGVKTVAVAADNAVFKIGDHGELLDLQRKKILYLPPDFSGEFVIPAGVTAIDKFAFSYCCNLTGVVIPERVTTIGAFAFDNCSGLRRVTIPDSMAIIESHAFTGCECLRQVSVPRRTVIRQRAFDDGCQIIRR